MRALRNRFPEARIDFLVASQFEEAAKLLPGIDQIIVFNKNEGWRGLLRLRRLLSRRYEIIVDLQNSLRSAFLRTFCFPLLWSKASRYRFRRWLLIRFKKNYYKKVLPVPLRYVDSVDTFGAKDDGLGLELVNIDTDPDTTRKNLVILCPGAKHATKKWPKENWKTLAESIKESGFTLVVCGVQSEAEVCREIAGDGEVWIDAPLAHIGALMKSSAAVVCHDSGLMHLATGVGARTVALFGPTVEEFGFFPFRGRSIVLQQQLACRPCSAFGADKCPLHHHNCMRLTTPDNVMQALREVSSRHDHE
ncbi:MAG: glycosyltransferase family 9 protein [Calditrichaeota bacterium]|nr:glycosyltransferase family 9 protein [Calditrichota bacterium]